MVVAEAVGVADMERFDADRTAEAVRRVILDQSGMAQQMGISSTPTFLVGTQLIQGAQPVAVFEQAIEQQLEASR